MTDKFLSAVIHREVQKMFEGNQNTIASVLAGEDPTAQIDPDAARVVLRSMKLSVQMAVQLTIRVLESAKVIKSAPDFVAFAQMIDDEVSKGSEGTSE